MDKFPAGNFCCNGLAIVEGKPKYVTALGTTDTRDGWRADKPHGGCVIDIPSREFVTRGYRCPIRRAGTTAGRGRWNQERVA
jgi:hypothetical protein